MTDEVKPSQKITSAGCIFTNGKVILTGLQEKSGRQLISGIGGMCCPGESIAESAIRETIEELLNTTQVEPEVIRDVLESVAPKKIIENDTYCFLVYDFDQLTAILSVIYRHITSSVMYTSFPFTLTDLILNRLAVDAEISILCLLPLNSAFHISKYVMSDIAVMEQTII